jgi:hypothetical protein
VPVVCLLCHINSHSFLVEAAPLTFPLHVRRYAQKGATHVSCFSCTDPCIAYEPHVSCNHVALALPSPAYPAFVPWPCPCRCLAGAVHLFPCLVAAFAPCSWRSFVVIARHQAIVGLGHRSPTTSQWCAADMNSSPSRVHIAYLDATATISLSCSTHTHSLSTFFVL